MIDDVLTLWEWRERGATGRYLTLSFPKNEPIGTIGGQWRMSRGGVVEAWYTPEQFDFIFGKLIMPIEWARNAERCAQMKMDIAAK